MQCVGGWGWAIRLLIMRSVTRWAARARRRSVVCSLCGHGTHCCWSSSACSLHHRHAVGGVGAEGTHALLLAGGAVLTSAGTSWRTASTSMGEGFASASCLRRDLRADGRCRWWCGCRSPGRTVARGGRRPASCEPGIRGAREVPHRGPGRGGRPARLGDVVPVTGRLERLAALHAWGSSHRRRVQPGQAGHAGRRARPMSTRIWWLYYLVAVILGVLAGMALFDLVRADRSEAGDRHPAAAGPLRVVQRGVRGVVERRAGRRSAAARAPRRR